MLTDVPARSGLPTQLSAGYPMVFTTKLDEVRAFYLDVLGCEATIDVPGRYLQVRLTTGEGAPELGFMIVEEGAPNYTSGGFLLSVPVGDADAVQAALEKAGVPIAMPVEDKPWGWRSVYVVDPAGVTLDFFHVARAYEG